MKKALSLFILILIGVGGTLSVLGAKSSYVAEARFWRARQLAKRVVANPEVTPPFLYQKVKGRFEQLIKDYPENNVLVKESHLSIGGILIHEKKFEESREVLEKVRKEFPDDKLIGARAQFLTGFSYEKAGQWETALKEYKTLMSRYMESPFTLQVPLYIARRDLKQDTQKGAESYQEAAHYYRQVVSRYPKTPLGYFAMTFLVKGYEEQKKWEETLGAVKELVLSYPAALRVYLPVIDGTSRRLKEPGRALDIYESFIQSYPNHQDTPVLKRRVAQFRKES